jgi:hypothetical protein
MKIRNLMLLVAIGLGANGCGSGSEQHQDFDDVAARQMIEGVHLLVQTRINSLGKPPRKLSDLQAYSNAAPDAFDAISRGDIVVIWDTPTSDSKDEVLAYFKKTPSEGGYLVRQNGTVQRTKPDEFKPPVKTKSAG